MQNIERDKNLCIQGQKGKERQTDFQSVRGQPQFPLSGVVGSVPNLPKIIGQGERGAEGRVLEVWFLCALCVQLLCSETGVQQGNALRNFARDALKEAVCRAKR